MTTDNNIPLQVGQLTKDGVYIGRFKGENGIENDWFADTEDANKNGKRVLLNFNEAAQYAKDSTALKHHDWMVPPGYQDINGAPDILLAMFNNKAKFNNRADRVRGFDETGAFSAGQYWSSSPNRYYDCYAKFQRFSDGDRNFDFKSYGMSVRLVRSVPV